MCVLSGYFHFIVFSCEFILSVFCLVTSVSARVELWHKKSTFQPIPAVWYKSEYCLKLYRISFLFQMKKFKSFKSISLFFLMINPKILMSAKGFVWNSITFLEISLNRIVNMRLKYCGWIAVIVMEILFFYYNNNKLIIILVPN